MRRLLRSLALALVVAAVVTPATAAPRESGSAPAPQWVLKRIQVFLEEVSSRLFSFAAKDGSLMDPNGSPASADLGSGKSLGEMNTPPENTDHGSCMDPDGKCTEGAHLDDGSAMDPNG